MVDDRVKTLANQIRKQLFVGVEDDPNTQNLFKAVGSTAKRERLLNLVEVIANEDEDDISDKRTKILCITVKRNRKLRLHRVKHVGQVLISSKQWGLDEIKSIEYKAERKFSIGLNNLHEYRTTDALQTEAFIQMLVTLCNKYSQKPPKYVNMVGELNKGKKAPSKPTEKGKREESGKKLVRKPDAGTKTKEQPKSAVKPKERTTTTQVEEKGKREKERRTTETASESKREEERRERSAEVSEQIGEGEQDEYIDFDYEIEEGQENQQTAEDLLLDETFMLSADELLGDFGWRANIDAAELESRLISELSRLDSENVRAVLEADKRVPVVITELDKAINELEVMDQLLERYLYGLDSMGEDVRKIQIENENLKIEELNQQKLLMELEGILRLIAMPEEQLQILRKESLDTQQGIDRVQQVAAMLQQKLSTGLEGRLEEMEAAREKKKKYEFYCSNFSTRVYDYLKVIIQFKTEEALSKKPKSTGRRLKDIVAPAYVHDNLVRYTGFNLWLREFKPASDKELQALYIQTMNKLYSIEGNDLIDSCRFYFFKLRNNTIEYLFSQPASVTTSTQAVSFGTRRPSADKQDSGMGGNVLMGGGRRSDSISVDMQPYQAFSAASRTLITNVVVEQNFLADFFHYAPAKPSTGSKKGRKVDAYDPSTTSARITFNEWVTGGWESIGMWSVPRKYKVQSNINTEVKNILELLFGNLKAHLDSMIDMGTRFDPSQALGMIAAVEELEDMCKGTDQLFAIRLLEAAKKRLTTIFDQFVQAQMAAIDDKKLVTKKRSGVQPAVRIFPKFLSHMESLSGLNSPEAQELSNQTISKVGQHILDTFVNLVTESKTAAQGNDKDLLKEYLNSLILALTNLSTLRDGLAPLVSSSKSERLGTFNVAKHFYNISSRHAATFQHDYVMILIHRPMGRLIDFFSVVDDAYSRQQSPELIPGHNRASLKKLVAAHTQKEVKEAVKLLYKRAEKHLGSQPALLSAVWREVREDMLKLHQSFTATLTKFYTDSGITLEFRQADLLQWLDEQSR